MQRIRHWLNENTLRGARHNIAAHYDLGNEFFADCLSGMYTNWGYDKGRLTGRDYYEWRAWLRNQPYSKSHGSGEKRAAWFDYGYSTYDINACAKAYN